MVKLFKLPVLALMLPLLAAAAGASGASPAPRPRLTVLISIDQFRPDYLTRFNDLYLDAGSSKQPGGFRYLMEQGAWYADCRYQHARTVTGAGHAVLGTGAQPGVNGIIGNAWWDRVAGKPMYCVAARTARPVPESASAMSPENLLTTTVTDELEKSTGGQSRTVSVALKDRASILLAGRLVDTCIWFNDKSGEWVSSTSYCRDGQLPAWVRAFNTRALPTELRKTPWITGVKKEALARVWRPGGQAGFKHELGGDTFNAFAASPAGNRYVFETAKEAVTAEQLGKDAIPDILTINLSSNDYVGHRWGPDSAEVLDISVQTDRQLSEFLRFLAREVPGGLSSVAIAISADHGVAPVPEDRPEAELPGGRIDEGALAAAIVGALQSKIAPGDWLAAIENDEVYLKEKTVAMHEAKVSRARMEEIVAAAAMDSPVIRYAVGRSAILSGTLPHTPLSRRITLNFHPRRSGDVVLIPEPGFIPGKSGTTHGAPWPYDSHVPLLLAGPGIRPGLYTQPVAPAQVAPTLSHLSGTARPSGADDALLPGLGDP